MARLTKRHRTAIARGVRRYWRRVKTTSRERNVGIREARSILKVQRQEAIRAARPVKDLAELLGLVVPLFAGWRSPDPEGEAAFNLQDRDTMEPPPWTPRLAQRFRGFSDVTIIGYWEFRATPQSAAVSDNYEIVFDPGGTDEEFWSNYFDAIREMHDETLEGLGDPGEKYERFAIFVTRMK
jgi:hypothetical protein